MEIEPPLLSKTGRPVNTAAVASRGPQAKHWAGCTVPNYNDLDEAAFKLVIEPLADYYVYGREIAPDTGLPHLQFMVCFKTFKRMTAVKKMIPTQGHWEMKSSGSTMKQASDYCKKVGILIFIYLYINSYRMVIMKNLVLYL